MVVAAYGYARNACERKHYLARTNINIDILLQLSTHTATMTILQTQTKWVKCKKFSITFCGSYVSDCEYPPIVFPSDFTT